MLDTARLVSQGFTFFPLSSLFFFFYFLNIDAREIFRAYVFTRVHAGLGIEDKSPFTRTRFSEETIKSAYRGNEQRVYRVGYASNVAMKSAEKMLEHENKSSSVLLRIWLQKKIINVEK